PFDQPKNPEGTTAAMVVKSKLFWALRYNREETFLPTIDPRNIQIDPHATIRRPNGKRTPMTNDDLAAVLERAARNANGTYRAAAGRLLQGTILDGLRCEGAARGARHDTRPPRRG